MNEPTPGEVLDKTLQRQTARADELEARILQLELLARARGAIPLVDEDNVGEPRKPGPDSLDSRNTRRNHHRDFGFEGATT